MPRLWPIGHAWVFVFRKCCVVVSVNCLRYLKHLAYYLPLHCMLVMSTFLVVVCPCNNVCVHIFQIPTCHGQDVDIM